jgi:phosphoglucomutase
LQIKTDDHIILKDSYQQIFQREWEERKDELKSRFGFYSWEAIAYNGMAERRNLKRFAEAGRGGLKVLFLDDEGREIAYIWMRGSATEPVFRIMADVEGADTSIERYLLDWQRKMIMEADRSE